MPRCCSMWLVWGLWAPTVLQGTVDSPGLARAEGERSLPPDPAAPVLELAFANGGADRDDTHPVVAVSVYADGSVVVPEVQGGRKPVRGRLEPHEVQALLNEIVETQRVLDCETETLARALQSASRQTGLEWRVPTADTTVIRVHFRGKRHEVLCPAAELLCVRFPGVEELQRLCCVQRRLQNVRATVLVGGTQEAERLATLANRELRSRGADHVQVTTTDLQQVLGDPDGLRLVQFRRQEAGPLQPGASRWVVSIMESPEGPSRVSVTQLPQDRP